jgi:hypothetical protein
MQTPAQKRIERKNKQKASPSKEGVEELPTISLTLEPDGKKVCRTCKFFQSHPSGFCKHQKQHCARKQAACQFYG